MIDIDNSGGMVLTGSYTFDLVATSSHSSGSTLLYITVEVIDCSAATFTTTPGTYPNLLYENYYRITQEFTKPETSIVGCRVETSCVSVSIPDQGKDWCNPSDPYWAGYSDWFFYINVLNTGPGTADGTVGLTITSTMPGNLSATFAELINIIFVSPDCGVN